MELPIDKYVETALGYAPNIVKALLILVIGWWIIKRIIRLLNNMMDGNGVDKDLASFLSSLIAVVLKVLLVFTVAQQVGIQTTSFVALLAAAGFAVGMALQGSLGNFAAGVMVLLFKPYKTGDLIEVSDTKGWVEEIQIFNTILKTVTNQRVIIPNSLATADKVINHSSNGHIRVDTFFAMPYEEQFEKVQQAILQELESIPNILSEPAPVVGIHEFDSHNIKLGVFVYVKPEDYWNVYYNATLSIKKALGKSGVKMAYSEGIELGAIGDR